MSASVTELDDYRPHIVENMRCSACYHEFCSVRPKDGTPGPWECPECKKMTAAPSGWNVGMWGYFKDGKFEPEGWL